MAERAGQHERRARRAAEQVGDELERRVVRPLHVVEQDQDRRRGRHLLEQRAHGAVRAVALVLERRRGRRAVGGDRGEHARELGDAVAEHPHQPVLPEPGGVVVERVDPEAEREVALELGAAAGEHDAAALLAAPGELLQQARLADARLAADRDVARLAAESLQGRRRRGQLPAAADEHAGVTCQRRHTRTVAPRVTTGLRWFNLEQIRRRPARARRRARRPRSGRGTGGS